MILPDHEISPSIEARVVHINQWLTPGLRLTPHHRELDAAVGKAMLEC